MSKLLRPGMRVRFVSGSHPNVRFPWPVGTTGVIVLDRGASCTARWQWRPDKPAPVPAFANEKFAYSPSEHLEPIVDPPALSSWESCGFHPRDFLRESEKEKLDKPLKKQDEPIPR